MLESAKGLSMGIGRWILLLLVVVVVIAWAIAMYGTLVSLRHRFRKAFTPIDVQLRRRYDLIPSLVETAAAYIAHEREALDAVIAARSVAVQAAQRAASAPGAAPAMRELGQAEAELASAIGRLAVVVDGYPRLKANETMLALQEELTRTENRVAFARQGYNDSVLEYNIRRERFPVSLLAILFAFTPATPLRATESPRELPTARVPLP